MRLRGTRNGERYGDVLGEGICQAGACNDNDKCDKNVSIKERRVRDIIGQILGLNCRVQV